MPKDTIAHLLLIGEHLTKANHLLDQGAPYPYASSLASDLADLALHISQKLDTLQSIKNPQEWRKPTCQQHSLFSSPS